MKLILLLFLTVLSCHSFSQTFTGGGGPINDYQTTTIPIVVSGLPTTIDTTNFGLETVCFTINHTYDGDLTLALVSPNGTVAQLFSGVGGGGQNFTATCLNTNAASSISSNSAPFTGTYKPVGQMGLVNNGGNPNGTWELLVTDSYGADQGNVVQVSISFGTNPASYFALTSSLLPIVAIETNGNTIADDPKVMADMKIIYNGVGIRNYLTDTTTDYSGKIGIEYRGNYSASLPQKPYAFETWDSLGNAINVPLLGMPAENDWLLIANYNDKSFARNILPFHFFDEMGHYSIRSRLVDVVLDGNYQGIYLLCEKIKRDNNRVNIANLTPTEITSPDVTGGYMLKIDYWDNSNSWQLNYSPINCPTSDVHMVYVSPNAIEIVPQQASYIQNYINDFETALYSSTFDDPLIGYRKYIDVGSFIDYFLVNEVTRNIDGFKKSRYFSKDKDLLDGTLSRLKAGPVWDFDWSQKDINAGTQDGSGFIYGECNQDVIPPGWYIRLLEDPTFANEVRCRYNELRASIFDTVAIQAKIDSVAQVVNESQNWHYLVWGNMGVASGTGEVQAPSQSYAEEIQKLKDWYNRRFAWLDTNMPGDGTNCTNGITANYLEQKISLFPNPITDQLTINWSDISLTGASVSITDATGRTVVTTQISSADQANQQLRLNELGGLLPGFYSLIISDGVQQVVVKICK
jgi:subtilisin-like proprotein convertase family protein